MLIILERRIDAKGGHEQTQIAAIERLAETRDLAIVACQNDAIFPRSFDDVRVRRVLTGHEAQRKNPDQALADDLGKMRALFTDNGPFPIGAALFVPTATAYDLKLVVHACRHAPDLIRFHVRLLEERHFLALDSAERNDLAQAVAEGQVRIVTETRALSELMRENWGIEAAYTMLLPCTLAPEEALAHVPRAGWRQVSFLGGMRNEKGRRELPAIIAQLTKALRARGPEFRTEFAMQARRRHRFWPKSLIYNLRVALGAGMFWGRSPVRVRSLPAFMDATHFKTELAQSDVMVVPYRVENYKNRGSGIIIDAVMAEVPLVYTQGIGMSELTEFGNGRAADSPEGFAAAIVDLLENPVATKAACQKARAFTLLQIETAANYLKSLQN